MAKYCVLSAGGPEKSVNDNDKDSNIIFTIKDKVICQCCNFISKTQSKTIKTSRQRLWNYNVIINGKNDQLIDSDIERYEKIRKLTTRQYEDYTTKCLLNHNI